MSNLHQSIRTLIVDDETLARRRILHMLEAEADIEVVGEAANGREALKSIDRLRPDLVFLDVQMPVYSGLETLRRLSPEDIPHIIFVTAYDQYALEAFDVNAVDYLLKPFDRKRFAEALKRVRSRLRVGAAGADELRSLRNSLAASSGGQNARLIDRLAIRDSGNVTFVKLADIQWIEAAQNYVKIHTARSAHLMRSSIKELEARLDPQRFIRIHRSTLVNIDAIKEISPGFHGDKIARLYSGTRLTVARTRRNALARLFGE